MKHRSTKTMSRLVPREFLLVEILEDLGRVIYRVIPLECTMPETQVLYDFAIDMGVFSHHTIAGGSLILTNKSLSSRARKWQSNLHGNERYVRAALCILDTLLPPWENLSESR